MFSEQETDCLRLSMSATLENIDAADNSISAYLERKNPPLDRFALRIMLREALLNAVIHGSEQHEDMEVSCELRLGEKDAQLTVEDQGHGFTWQNREITFDITGDGGRGLALMQMYSSQMILNEIGNRIELRKDYDTVNTADDGNEE